MFFIVMMTMITSAKKTLLEIMITNKQTNKQTKKQKNKQKNKYIVKTTLFELMITNKQTNILQRQMFFHCNDDYDPSCNVKFFEIMITNKKQKTNKQTNKQIYC